MGLLEKWLSMGKLINELMMTKLMKKALVVFFVVSYSVFIVYYYYSNRLGEEENLDRQFNGVIENVHYDEKSIPYVEIDKKEYYLNMGYYFGHKLEIGDTLVKNKGSEVYKLIKRTSGEVVLFNR